MNLGITRQPNVFMVDVKQFKGTEQTLGVMWIDLDDIQDNILIVREQWTVYLGLAAGFTAFWATIAWFLTYQITKSQF